MRLSLLVGIIISMGFLGGIINFLINQKKKYKTQWSCWIELIKAVVIGIGAATLVPLFLAMTSSDLLVRTGEDDYSYFVFAGFCLIAAISSHKFIGSIADQILIAANEAIAKAEKLESNLEPIIAKATEQEVANEPNCGTEDISFKIDDSEEMKILKAITFSKYTYRNLNGLTKTTKLDKAVVNEKLVALIAEGSVEQTIRKESLRYYITEFGRDRIFKPQRQLPPVK